MATNNAVNIKSVSLTGLETVTEKSFDAPKFTFGSDAAGDLYYRSSPSGYITRLGIGAEGKGLYSDGTKPFWNTVSTFAFFDEVEDTYGGFTTVGLDAKQVQSSASNFVLRVFNGGLIADIPDGTTTGGNARGLNTVDLQMQRTSSDQVAGRTYSFTAGKDNKVTYTGNQYDGGAASIVFGYSNTTEVYASIIAGTSHGIVASNTPNKTLTGSVHFGDGHTSNGVSGNFCVGHRANPYDRGDIFVIGAGLRNEFIIECAAKTTSGSNFVQLVRTDNQPGGSTFILPPGTAGTGEITIVAKRASADTLHSVYTVPVFFKVASIADINGNYTLTLRGAVSGVYDTQLSDENIVNNDDVTFTVENAGLSNSIQVKVRNSSGQALQAVATFKYVLINYT